MEEKGTNFALLAIVAIVAIVALIILLKAQTQPKMVTLTADNNAGQMMRASGSDTKCNANENGGCSGTCESGKTCGESGSSCGCS